MTSILIAGPAKSGTTALYSSAKANLPDCLALYEPSQAYQFDLLARKALEGVPIVSKIIYPNVELENYDLSYFDKKIIVTRDPRDRLVSWMLYVSFLNDRFLSNGYSQEFIKLLQEKEADPTSVSLVQIAELMSSYGFDLKLDEDFESDLNGAVHLLAEYPNSFVVSYEDYIAGDVADLTEYTGLPLSTETKVSNYIQYNERAKTSDGWRHWFTPEDVKFFRPKMSEYMRYFDYADDWALAEDPIINPEHSSMYVDKYFKRLKVLPNRFGRLRLERDYTSEYIAHLKSAADNGAEGAMIELALVGLYGYGDEVSKRTYMVWIDKAISYGSPLALIHLGAAIEANIIDDDRKPEVLFARAGSILGNAAAKRTMQEVRRAYHLNDPVRFAKILDVTVTNLQSSRKEVQRLSKKSEDQQKHANALKVELNFATNRARESEAQVEVLRSKLQKSNNEKIDFAGQLDKQQREIRCFKKDQAERKRGQLALAEENNLLKNDIERHERAEKIRRQSISSQFIVHTRRATNSFSGFVRYPLSLWRLFRRWLKRRAARKVLPQSAQSVPRVTPPVATAKNKDKKALVSEVAALNPEAVKKYIAQQPALESVQYILYADISLQVIDGSSIWLTSMANLLSRQTDTLLLLKTNPTHSNLTKNLNGEKLCVMRPDDIGMSAINVNEAIKVIELMDRVLPKVNSVFIRGLDAACTIHESRQFKQRTALYLTDFYSYGSSGRGSTQEQAKKVCSIKDDPRLFLVQTQEIKSALELLAGQELPTHLLPPMLPSLPVNSALKRERKNDAVIKLVYAGKVTPEWGVIEFFDSIELLRESGRTVFAEIISNKISAKENARHFRSTIINRAKALDVELINGLPRKEVFEHLSAADFIWCWRPASLELHTIELSTKLVEAAALANRAIVYPSKANVACLGEEYPYYMENPADIVELLSKKHDFDFDALSVAVKSRHDSDNIHKGFSQLMPKQTKSGSKLLFACHDWKFIDPYISSLKSAGKHVLCDSWEWGEAQDIERSRQLYSKADVIFCEWGLANAVWYSQNNDQNKPLFIRLHAQEVRAKAAKFGAQINIENVTKAIFVSEVIRQKAIKLWGWPAEKTMVIPNFVMDDEYKIAKKTNKKITLGLLGIVPTLKRLDRAISLLEHLLAQGYDVELKIKGHRPEDLPFMHAAGRKSELEYYQDQYARIDANPVLKKAIEFLPFGSDVALWYQGIDYILSASDSESFHYALADGVLSGCLPIVWAWEGADLMFPNEWLVQDYEGAVARFKNLEDDRDHHRRLINENRSIIVERYGQKIIFEKISKEIFTAESAVIESRDAVRKFA